MDDNRIRTIISFMSFAVLIIMAVYLYRNVEYLERDPCDACEKGTGFRCQNFGLNVVYHNNGSLYRPQSQPNVNILSNSSVITALCKGSYMVDVGNLSGLFGGKNG